MAKLIHLTLCLSIACVNSDKGSDLDDIQWDSGAPSSGEDQDESGADSPVDSSEDLFDSGEEADDSGDDNVDTGHTDETELEGFLSEFAVRTTHNSYSGGARQDILTQLNNGVRGLEFDIHDDDYQQIGDYQIGHYHPGGEVDHSGFNPASNRLSDWLEQISDWSSLNAQHVPLTLVLDIKDNLTDNVNFASGNFAALNDKLLSAFGERLHVANGEALPDLSLIRDKVICVISGDEQSRERYKRDKGENPSISINDLGQVLAVHDSGTGYLWYWTGQTTSEGTIHWLRHGRYGTGVDPAVAINNAGHFVVVHKSENHDDLWGHTGQLLPTGEVLFSSNFEYDSGISPTIQFLSKDSSELIERHLSENSGLVWEWSLSLNPHDLSVSFDGNHQTQSSLFLSDQDGDFSIYTGGHAWAGSDTLLYRTADGATQRVRYPQLCYVEVQPGDSSELSHHETHFFAASAGDLDSLSTWTGLGLIRGWGFNQSHALNGFLYHYPAADDLFASWIDDWCVQNNCIE